MFEPKPALAGTINGAQSAPKGTVLFLLAIGFKDCFVGNRAGAGLTPSTISSNASLKNRGGKL